MIHTAPLSFFAAVLVGWIVGWLILRAWYRRTIQIGEDRLALAENQRDIEKGQKEGLRAAFRELKPDASVLAIELSHGDPDLRDVVVALGRGEKITTPVDPSTAAVELSVRLTPEDIKKVAQLNYTSANNLSQTIAVGPAVATSASPIVYRILDQITHSERMSLIDLLEEAKGLGWDFSGDSLHLVDLQDAIRQGGRDGALKLWGKLQKWTDERLMRKEVLDPIAQDHWAEFRISLFPGLDGDNFNVKSWSPKEKAQGYCDLHVERADVDVWLRRDAVAFKGRTKS